jgi:hypothetical protein
MREQTAAEAFRVAIASDRRSQARRIGVGVLRLIGFLFTEGLVPPGHVVVNVVERATGAIVMAIRFPSDALQDIEQAMSSIEADLAQLSESDFRHKFRLRS